MYRLVDRSQTRQICCIIFCGKGYFRKYAIWSIIELEENIMVQYCSYNVTKFHKILIKTTGLIDLKPSKIVNFHEQRATIPEGMVQYRLLSYLKKLLW